MAETLTVEELLLRLRNYARSHPDALVVLQVEGEAEARLIHTSMTYSLDEQNGRVILVCRQNRPS